jgi:hypothetical protein
MFSCRIAGLQHVNLSYPIPAHRMYVTCGIATLARPYSLPTVRTASPWITAGGDIPLMGDKCFGNVFGALMERIESV